MDLVGCDGQSGSRQGVVLSEFALGPHRFSVVDVDLQATTLKLFWKKPDGERFDNFHSLAGYLKQSGQRLLFATNAGIFESSFTPCGLLIEDGRELAPLNLKAGSGNFYLKPNGVFLVEGGGARIVVSEKYSPGAPRVLLATQSGPLLLMYGKINSRFAPDSTSRRIRSGVGIVTAQRIVFILSRDPVTFYEFAAVFQSLHCSQALYLDGTISRFYQPNGPSASSDEHFAAIFAVLEKQRKLPIAELDVAECTRAFSSASTACVQHGPQAGGSAGRSDGGLIAAGAAPSRCRGGDAISIAKVAEAEHPVRGGREGPLRNCGR
jgi:uncharacterized protein YigE (DUF2233 family)